MIESKDNEPNKNNVQLPEWLTADIFVDIIKKDEADFVNIIKFKAEPAVSTGENFMTVLLRVQIDVELKDGKTSSLTYMVKIPPNAEERKETVKLFHVFEKESYAYQVLLPEFEKMYARRGKTLKFGPHLLPVNTERINDDTLFMEDLRVQGYRNVQRQLGMNMEHTQRTLEKLAQLHASSASYYESNGPYVEFYEQCLGDGGDTDLFPELRRQQGAAMRKCLPLYTEDVQLAEKLKIFENSRDPYQMKTKTNSKEFRVLNHGDCWANNVMFKYTSSDSDEIDNVLFVDYQMSRYASPAQDLLYLLLSSTSLEIKLKHFDHFVRFYHEKLCENLQLLDYKGPEPSLRDLHKAIYDYADWAYTICIFILPIVLLDPSGDANVDNLYDEGNKGGQFKKALFTNKRYVQHMSQMLTWMNDRGFLECAQN